VLRSFVGSFPTPVLNQLNFDFDILSYFDIFARVYMCHDHSSPGVDSRGHRSKVRARVRVRVGLARAVGLTSVHDRGQFVFYRQKSRSAKTRERTGLDILSLQGGPKSGATDIYSSLEARVGVSFHFETVVGGSRRV